MKFENIFGNFDVLTFPIILLDRNFKVLNWNDSASSVFKYHKSEAIGSNVIDLIVPDHVTELGISNTKFDCNT